MKNLWRDFVIGMVSIMCVINGVVQPDYERLPYPLDILIHVNRYRNMYCPAGYKEKFDFMYLWPINGMHGHTRALSLQQQDSNIEIKMKIEGFLFLIHRQFTN